MYKSLFEKKMIPLHGNLKSILFKDLKIDDYFSTGRSKGAGILSNELHELIYQKISKSQAKLINGTSNYKRHVSKGGTFSYSPNTTVFINK